MCSARKYNNILIYYLYFKERNEIFSLSLQQDRVNKYLMGIFNAMDVELNINSIYEDGVIHFDITGEKAGIIIGYRGDTLDALQLLATNAGNKGRTEYIRILIDVENYRKKRVKALEELANRKAAVVINKGRSITLEPMSPYERRIIHTTLQNHPKVKELQEGKGFV